MLESKVERTACKKIRELLGIESTKLNVRGETGLPDRLFWIPGGRPLFIEFNLLGR